MSISMSISSNTVGIAAAVTTRARLPIIGSILSNQVIPLTTSLQTRIYLLKY